MQVLPSQIFIYPSTLIEHGEKFNNFEQGLDDSDVYGWNVQAFDLIDGTAGIIDEGYFADFDSAFAYAQELSRQHQIPIDCMEDKPADLTDRHAADHDAPQMLETRDYQLTSRFHADPNTMTVARWVPPR